MELKEFVKKVITDLVEAVEDVRATSSRDMHLSRNEQSRTVEFDIAVSVEETSGKSGKAGVRVLEFIQAGGDIAEQSKNSTVSRVKFGIDVNSMTKESEARMYRQ